MSSGEFFAPEVKGLVHLEQRTQQWHDWRNGLDLDGKPRVTATMASVIAGDSVSTKTPHLLWQELTGRRQPEAVSEFVQRAMARGTQLEPMARQAYIETTGNEVQEVCVQHPDHPWAAASLDGLTPSGDIILELKCPTSQRVHDLAKAQKLPSYYVPQVQWQLLCTLSAREVHYASYFPDDEKGEKLVVVPMRRDRRYLEWLFREALNFRLALIEDRPPASDAWLLAAKQYRAAKAAFDEAEARLKSYEATLLASMPEGSEVQDGAGVRLTRFTVRGPVAYDKMLASLSQDAQAVNAAIEASRKPGEPDYAKAAGLLGNLSPEQVVALEDGFRGEGSRRHRITVVKDYEAALDPPIAPTVEPQEEETEGGESKANWEW